MSFGITNKDTNLRTGQGTDHDIRGKVGENRRVEIMDRDGDWVKVEVKQGDHKGKVGWMWGDNIDKDKKDESDNGCFPASTRILTPTGRCDIASFKPGDLVLSWDVETSSLVARHVTKVLSHKPTVLVALHFSSDRSPLLVTQFHSILTNRGYIRVGQVKPGDLLFDSNMNTLPVSHIEQTNQKVPVYNLITSGEHNFIAEGLIAHNFTFCRKARTFMHQFFFDWRYAPATGNRRVDLAFMHTLC